MSTEARRAVVPKRKEKGAPKDDGKGVTTDKEAVIEKNPEMGTVIEKEAGPANAADRKSVV